MMPFTNRFYSALTRRVSPVFEPIPGAVFSARGWLDARPGVAYISDGAGWVLDDVGYQIAARISDRFRYQVMTSYRGLRDTIVHFAAPPLYLKDGTCYDVHETNVQLLTWTHGLPDNPDPNIQRQIDQLAESEPYLTRIMVQTTTARDFLVSRGVAEDKIVHIPLGIDTTVFRPPTAAERAAARVALGIPEEAVCIGSFQKDSPGWDNSNRRMKWVKGPDVLVDVLERLAKSYPLFVLLTTPSRGYVIERLERAGIAYRHDMLTDTALLPHYYHALDVYLIPARDEGGPMAMLEAMASGVPVVSTRMGIPRDAITHGVNGWLADVDDVDGLASGADAILSNAGRAAAIAGRARQTMGEYDWRIIANAYAKLFYVLG